MDEEGVRPMIVDIMEKPDAVAHAFGGTFFNVMEQVARWSSPSTLGTRPTQTCSTKSNFPKKILRPLPWKWPRSKRTLRKPTAPCC